MVEHVENSTGDVEADEVEMERAYKVYANSELLKTNDVSYVFTPILGFFYDLNHIADVAIQSQADPFQYGKSHIFTPVHLRHSRGGNPCHFDKAEGFIFLSISSFQSLLY